MRWSRRGWTPFSGSSRVTTDPDQGFTATAASASTRSVPSDRIRVEHRTPFLAHGEIQGATVLVQTHLECLDPRDHGPQEPEDGSEVPGMPRFQVIQERRDGLPVDSDIRDRGGRLLRGTRCPGVGFPRPVHAEGRPGSQASWSRRRWTLPEAAHPLRPAGAARGPRGGRLPGRRRALPSRRLQSLRQREPPLVERPAHDDAGEPGEPGEPFEVGEFPDPPGEIVGDPTRPRPGGRPGRRGRPACRRARPPCG